MDTQDEQAMAPISVTETAPGQAPMIRWFTSDVRLYIPNKEADQKWPRAIVVVHPPLPGDRGTVLLAGPGVDPSYHRQLLEDLVESLVGQVKRQDDEAVRRASDIQGLRQDVHDWRQKYHQVKWDKTEGERLADEVTTLNAELHEQARRAVRAERALKQRTTAWKRAAGRGAKKARP